MNARLRRAWEVAGAVPDPELPMLSLADLGVLQRVEESGDRIRVGLIPTHAGCPALGAIRADVVRALAEAGIDAEVRIDPTPAWTSDLISARGREALREAGIAPPGPVGGREEAEGVESTGLELGPTRFAASSEAEAALTCPRCGSSEVEVLSEFGPTRA